MDKKILIVDDAMFMKRHTQDIKRDGVPAFFEAQDGEEARPAR